MKKTIHIFLLFATVGLANAQINIPKKGLVGYWPFSGNANDSSGYANNPTFNNAILTKDRDGNENSAYQFNGANYISIPNSISLQSADQSITIAAWVKINNWATFYNINYASVLCKSNTTSSTQYRLSIISNGASVINNGQYADYNGTSISLSKWMHVAVSCSPTSFDMYVNGILVGSKIFNTTFPYNSNLPLEIGRDYAGSVDYFNGIIDDVVIYNRTLTLCEIQQLAGDPNACLTTDVYNQVLEGRTNPKTLLRVVNPLGQEIKPDNAVDGIFIYQYSDGSITKMAK